MSETKYPKRLIEVDLPIRRISAHARREKSIRHGHISTLHIWWARRPLAACRAVICAALWPDPADELCPQAFREAAVEQIVAFARRVSPKKITAEGKLLSSEKHLSFESRGRWEAIAAETPTLDADEPADMGILQLCLLDFIADFANWDNSTVPAYLETSRALTQAAHEALGGVPGTRPLVVDPFAGGGSIPLEALRVWAAVSTEALSMIFEDADAAGLEPDARLTAMWLWTLGGMAADGDGSQKADGDGEKVVASTGYTLEFDAARKIAQGLGIHLEQSESIDEVKGDKARLLPASERTRHLFGKDEATAATARGRRKKKEQQRSLFEELDELEAEAEAVTSGELKPQAGETVLDRVHQSMILFAAGRGEALRRFLVDDGAGTDARFWKLAQSLSALYPKETDEKRWVDGVLARKKGLGL